MLLWLSDQCNSLAAAATKSDFSAGNDGAAQTTKVPGTSITIQTQPQSTGSNDTLDFYFTPKRSAQESDCKEETQKAVWKTLWNLYDGTQPTLDEQFWKDDSVIPLKLELRTFQIKDKKERD